MTESTVKRRGREKFRARGRSWSLAGVGSAARERRRADAADENPIGAMGGGTGEEKFHGLEKTIRWILPSVAFSCNYHQMTCPS
jgi:hypothetical protein